MRLKWLKSNKGTSMIIFSLSLTVIIGFGAIVIDIGRANLERSIMQNAIDAAALAAAQDLPDTSKAAATANDYIRLNGYEPSEITITFSGSNKTISITGHKEVNYTLARVLGFDSVIVSPGAAAQKIYISDCFDYALFSGSKTTTLVLNGSIQYVGGSCHTNKNFSASGTNITITGACEAATTITVNGSHNNIDNRYPNSPYIDMPDFSEMIRLQAENAGQLYIGDKTFDAGSIVVDEPIFVDGNVTVNGSRFVGKGCILATGNITFNGSNLNATTSDAVCFYSKNGNITVNGSNAVLDGMIYAPSGSITLNGSSQTINGRVISDTVIINGSDIHIQSGENDLSSLPSKGVKLIR